MHPTKFSSAIRRVLSWYWTVPTSEREHHEQEKKEAILRTTRVAGCDDPLILCSEFRLIDDEGKPVDSEEVSFNKDITYLCIRQIEANQVPDRNETRRIQRLVVLHKRLSTRDCVCRTYRSMRISKFKDLSWSEKQIEFHLWGSGLAFLESPTADSAYPKSARAGLGDCEETSGREPWLVVLSRICHDEPDSSETYSTREGSVTGFSLG